MGRSARWALAAVLVGVAAPGCTVGERPPGPMFDAGRPDVVFVIDAAVDAGRTMDASDAGTDTAVDAPVVRDVTLPDGGPDRTCTAEVCSNGLDDDCNGVVDDGCACVPGDTASCFGGAPAHRGHGLCVDGTTLCSGADFGSWGECVGDVLEGTEVCDPDGLDEDCDGTVNEGCECDDGDPPLPCGTDVGACVAGVQRCVGGMLTGCEGEVRAAAETCDGTDEDCDGSVDEGLTQRCGMDVGACRTGIATCSAGAWGACVGEVGPGTESCDGTDEDCDGTIDETTDRVCGTDVGECIAGVQHCTSGSYGACIGSRAPRADGCNGRDDDCDGDVDEALDRPCGTDVGACTSSTQTCLGGSWMTTCPGSIGPHTEICEGAVDENCDGTVDEGCGCTTGTTRPCGTTRGRCVAGTQTCDASGMWGACAGSIDPIAEVCDGVVDDDCDGVVDDGCACATGATRACGTDVGDCVAGTETCNADGMWDPCAGSVGPTTEICNGRDDDCDGAIDGAGVCPRLPPLAMCPAPRTTVAGMPVTLVGMGSDPDGGPVTYAWTVVVRPGGSAAMPATPTSDTTGFTPDAAGDYTIRFCVTDDEATTTCCTTTVTATPSCTPPATVTPLVCGTSWDRQPIVEFAPLPSGQTYELFVDGAPTPYGTVTAVGQNYFRPSSPIAAGGAPPGTRSTLTIRACTSPTCCSATTSASVNMVESCTTPRAPVAGDIVFSEYVIAPMMASGVSCPSPQCQAGEAIELTNLSNCPIALAGNHFFACNASCSSGSYRWMEFGPDDVIPPRGVYVAIRNQSASMCSYPFFGTNNPGLFGLRISALTMQGMSIDNGWFNNAGVTLTMATGGYSGGPPPAASVLDTLMTSSMTGSCGSVGYDAVNRCGDLSSSGMLSTLSSNQLGRLWRPCDAVTAPNPPMCM